jgi:hypothetical protein
VIQTKGKEYKGKRGRGKGEMEGGRRKKNKR